MTSETTRTPDEKTYADEHPEQDPAEGSSETVEHDLEEADEAAYKRKRNEDGAR